MLRLGVFQQYLRILQRPEWAGNGMVGFGRLGRESSRSKNRSSPSFSDCRCPPRTHVSSVNLPGPHWWESFRDDGGITVCWEIFKQCERRGSGVATLGDSRSYLPRLVRLDDVHGTGFCRCSTSGRGRGGAQRCLWLLHSFVAWNRHWSANPPLP